VKDVLENLLAALCLAAAFLIQFVQPVQENKHRLVVKDPGQKISNPFGATGKFPLVRGIGPENLRPKTIIFFQSLKQERMKRLDARW